MPEGQQHWCSAEGSQPGQSTESWLRHAHKQCISTGWIRIRFRSHTLYALPWHLSYLTLTGSWDKMWLRCLIPFGIGVSQTPEWNKARFSPPSFQGGNCFHCILVWSFMWPAVMFTFRQVKRSSNLLNAFPLIHSYIRCRSIFENFKTWLAYLDPSSSHLHLILHRLANILRPVISGGLHQNPKIYCRFVTWFVLNGGHWIKTKSIGNEVRVVSAGLGKGNTFCCRQIDKICPWTLVHSSLLPDLHCKYPQPDQGF